MPSAFVLISSDFGSSEVVASELQKIEGIAKVWLVTGVYDIIAKINVQIKEDLDRINTRIKALDEVQTTMTLIVLQGE
ncbi:MAG TPA: Lrp/AsnC ligand binding domain-containing protein [Nitrososphaeraceae archaeon]